MYPVAETVIDLVPAPCKAAAGTEAEGVNVILPASESDQPAVRLTPSIVIDVMPTRQAGSSVKVMSKAPSTVATVATTRVGGLEAVASAVVNVPWDP